MMHRADILCSIPKNTFAISAGNTVEFSIMTTLQEIEHAIEKLPNEQFSELHDWIVEKDWEIWDDQIQKDSESGKLSFLVKEAQHDAQAGNTKPI